MTPASAYDPTTLSATLEALREQPIDTTERGFTAFRTDRSPAQLTGSGADLLGFTLPLMVAREEPLEHNLATMAAWCREHQVLIAPHGKTSMSPQILARQLTAGAWGITAATIAQVRAFVEIGVRRILLANQLVDALGIGWLAEALEGDPGLTVIGYVDSRAGVELLDAALSAHGFVRRLPVLVELGLPGGRTGARSEDAAVEVARVAAASPFLDVVGVSGFEGVLGHDRDAASLEAVAEFCQGIRRVGLRLREEGLLDGRIGPEPLPILSAGGSHYFDVVARELRAPTPPTAPADHGTPGAEEATVVIRSGGYATSDDGFLGGTSPFSGPDATEELRPALEAWAYVLSCPEPGLALVGAGKRDVPYDIALPNVRRIRTLDGQGWRDRDLHGRAVEVTKLNDQHAFLTVPEGVELAVGDRVCFGISHPCTAFDKWRVIPVLDGDDRVTDVLHTLF